MAYDFLIAVLTFIFLVVMHEAGHVICALSYSLKIEKVGFTFKPLPHPYVIVNNIPENHIKYFFLFAGIIMTIMIFFLLWATNLIFIKGVYYGICTHFIFETNPFYSDLTQAFRIFDKEKFDLYKRKSSGSGNSNFIKMYKDPLKMKMIMETYFDKYKYSFLWYIHLSLWTIVIILLLSPKGLINYFIN